MKKAVVIGAGKIGRGFIGQIFNESGYQVTFLDVNIEIVNILQENGRYSVYCVSGDGVERHDVMPVQAICTSNFSHAADALATCDIAATAVGKNAWPFLPPLLCESCKRRKKALDVLLCENIPSARNFAYEQLNSYTPDEKWQEKIGFVPVSVGRMVPENQGRNGVDVFTEPYLSLPVDVNAFLCEVPNLKYMEVCKDYALFEARKLYLHNMGHAVCAYLGYRKGLKEISDCMEDHRIYETTASCMYLVGSAICRKFNAPQSEMATYIQSLLYRFGNPSLHDTVARVGADPERKLSQGDRLLGAYKLITDYGMECSELEEGIAAALLYNAEGDASASHLQEKIKEIGAVAYLQINGISKNDALRIEARYQRKKENKC